MTIEVASFIGNLVTTYPEATADYSECDDHLRLIKSAVKASFPLVTGAVTVTEAQINLLTDSTKTVGETLVRFSLSIVDNDSILTASDDALARLSLTVSAASTRVALLETLGFQGQSLTIVTTARTFSVS